MAPCKISQWVRVELVLRRVTASALCSTASGVLPVRDTGAVTDAEDMRVDRDTLLSG